MLNVETVRETISQPRPNFVLYFRRVEVGARVCHNTRICVVDILKYFSIRGEVSHLLSFAQYTANVFHKSALKLAQAKATQNTTSLVSFCAFLQLSQLYGSLFPATVPGLVL